MFVSWSIICYSSLHKLQIQAETEENAAFKGFYSYTREYCKTQLMWLSKEEQ